MSRLKINVCRLPHGFGIPLPEYQTKGSSGIDLAAAINEPVIMEPKDRILLPTGFMFAIPIGYEAQIRPRSGLALKHGITVLNSPGTIDSDYRGEVSVILINLGIQNFKISRGDRIAQMVFAKIERGVLIDVEILSKTSRGTSGYGSTGIESDLG